MLEIIVGLPILVGCLLIIYLVGCLIEWKCPYKSEIIKNWKIWVVGLTGIMALGSVLFLMYVIGDAVL